MFDVNYTGVTIPIKGLFINGAYGAVHPHALFIGNSHKTQHSLVFLYYTPYPSDEHELPYLAVSSDFMNFQVVSKKPLFSRGNAGSWDDHHLADLDVLKTPGGKWFMYYAGATYRGNEKKVSIGVALSNNGITWEKLDEPILTASDVSGVKSVLTPSVLWYDGKFVMVYEGYDGKNSSLYISESADGFDFRHHRLLISSESLGVQYVNHPHLSIIRFQGKVYFLMLFLTGLYDCFELQYAIINPDADYQILKISRIKGMSYRRKVCRILKNNPKIKRLFHFNRFFWRNVLFRGDTLNSRLATILPSLYFYRVSILTKPNREVVITRNGSSIIYYTIYNAVFLIPSISLALVKIKMSDGDYCEHAERLSWQS